MIKTKKGSDKNIKTEKIRLRSDKNIKIRKHKIIKISIITIVIILLSAQIVYAKYLDIDKVSNVINIAKPIFIVEGTEVSKISEINKIGYYEFSIKNFNETDISEIGFLYTIEIISNTDESIQFELYNENEPILLTNQKTEELLIKGSEKIEQKYKLKITYDSTKGTQGKDILEEVQIKVHSEQERI